MPGGEGGREGPPVVRPERSGGRVRQGPGWGLPTRLHRGRAGQWEVTEWGLVFFQASEQLEAGPPEAGTQLSLREEAPTWFSGSSWLQFRPEVGGEAGPLGPYKEAPGEGRGSSGQRRPLCAHGVA